MGWGPSYDGVTVKNNFVEIKGKRSFDARCDIHDDDDHDDHDDDHDTTDCHKILLVHLMRPA